MLMAKANEHLINLNEAIPAEAMLIGQREVLELIAKGAPLRETLSAIAAFAERHIPGMKASILYYDPAIKKLRRGGYGQLPSSFADIVDGLVPSAKAGSCGTCAWRKERVISEDVFIDPLWDGFHDLCRAYDIRSAWSSPLLSYADDGLLGVFGMYHPKVRVPTVADLQIVDQFTHLATIATQRHRTDETNRYRANYDALTQLRNRYGLMSEVGTVIESHLSTQTPLSLVFIDLDSFKGFNDAFGHLDADQLLRNVCDKIQATLKDAQLLARFGGDEFVTLLPVSTEVAIRQLQVLRQVLAEGVKIAGHQLPVNFSAGVIAVTPEMRDIETLIFEADEAVRESKHCGGGHTLLVDAERALRSIKKRGLPMRIEAALDARNLYPHAQPIVRLSDQKIVGYELLFRLNDAQLASVPVLECIAEAERVGLIHRIGKEMLEAGVQFLARPEQQHSEVYLSINVSVRQLLQPDLADTFIEIVRRAGVDPGRICLEITESAQIDPGSPARNVINQFKSLGFKLAIDDFGTGYASLAHLQSLPFDVLKIDRQFVQQLDTLLEKGDRSNKSLVNLWFASKEKKLVSKGGSMCRALIAMAKACQLTIVAEGIETEAQAKALQRLGCQMGQGYLWAKPFPLDTIKK